MFHFQIESQEELVSRWHKKSTAQHCTAVRDLSSQGCIPSQQSLPFPSRLAVFINPVNQ